MNHHINIPVFELCDPYVFKSCTDVNENKSKGGCLSMEGSSEEDVLEFKSCYNATKKSSKRNIVHSRTESKINGRCYLKKFTSVTDSNIVQREGNNTHKTPSRHIGVSQKKKRKLVASFVENKKSITKCLVRDGEIDIKDFRSLTDLNENKGRIKDNSNARERERNKQSEKSMSPKHHKHPNRVSPTGNAVFKSPIITRHETKRILSQHAYDKPKQDDYDRRKRRSTTPQVIKETSCKSRSTTPITNKITAQASPSCTTASHNDVTSPNDVTYTVISQTSSWNGSDTDVSFNDIITQNKLYLEGKHKKYAFETSTLFSNERDRRGSFQTYSRKGSTRGANTTKKTRLTKQNQTLVKGKTNRSGAIENDCPKGKRRQHHVFYNKRTDTNQSKDETSPMQSQSPSASTKHASYGNLAFDGDTDRDLRTELQMVSQSECRSTKDAYTQSDRISELKQHVSIQTHSDRVSEVKPSFSVQSTVRKSILTDRTSSGFTHALENDLVKHGNKTSESMSTHGFENELAKPDDVTPETSRPVSGYALSQNYVKTSAKSSPADSGGNVRISKKDSTRGYENDSRGSKMSEQSRLMSNKESVDTFQQELDNDSDVKTSSSNHKESVTIMNNDPPLSNEHQHSITILKHDRSLIPKGRFDNDIKESLKPTTSFDVISQNNLDERIQKQNNTMQPSKHTPSHHSKVITTDESSQISNTGEHSQRKFSQHFTPDEYKPVAKKRSSGKSYNQDLHLSSKGEVSDSHFPKVGQMQHGEPLDPNKEQQKTISSNYLESESVNTIDHLSTGDVVDPISNEKKHNTTTTEYNPNTDKHQNNQVESDTSDIFLSQISEKQSQFENDLAGAVSVLIEPPSSVSETALILPDRTAVDRNKSPRFKSMARLKVHAVSKRPSSKGSLRNVPSIKNASSVQHVEMASSRSQANTLSKGYSKDQGSYQSKGHSQSKLHSQVQLQSQAQLHSQSQLHSKSQVNSQSQYQVHSPSRGHSPIPENSQSQYQKSFSQLHSPSLYSHGELHSQSKVNSLSRGHSQMPGNSQSQYQTSIPQANPPSLYSHGDYDNQSKGVSRSQSEAPKSVGSQIGPSKINTLESELSHHSSLENGNEQSGSPPKFSTMSLNRDDMDPIRVQKVSKEEFERNAENAYMMKLTTLQPDDQTAVRDHAGDFRTVSGTTGNTDGNTPGDRPSNIYFGRRVKSSTKSPKEPSRPSKSPPQRSVDSPRQQEEENRTNRDVMNDMTTLSYGNSGFCGRVCAYKCPFVLIQQAKRTLERCKGVKDQFIRRNLAEKVKSMEDLVEEQEKILQSEDEEKARSESEGEDGEGRGRLCNMGSKNPIERCSRHKPKPMKTCGDDGEDDGVMRRYYLRNGQILKDDCVFVTKKLFPRLRDIDR